MAEYTPRNSGRRFTDAEKAVLDDLWESHALRGVGKFYTPVIERVAEQLGRTKDEIMVSELSLLWFRLNLMLFMIVHSIWQGYVKRTQRKVKRQLRVCSGVHVVT